jgi:hypothetical protein
MSSIVFRKLLCVGLLLTAGPAVAQEKEKLKAADLQRVVTKILGDVEPAVGQEKGSANIYAPFERKYSLTPFPSPPFPSPPCPAVVQKRTRGAADDYDSLASPVGNRSLDS